MVWLWNAKGEISYSSHAASVRRECEASLRRLMTDIIDLYQIHWTADDLNKTIAAGPRSPVTVHFRVDNFKVHHDPVRVKVPTE